jgi:hypothetical protein
MAIERKQAEEPGAHEGKEEQHKSPKDKEKEKDHQNQKP